MVNVLFDLCVGSFVFSFDGSIDDDDIVLVCGGTLLLDMK